mgnify:CR=1 FL=1
MGREPNVLWALFALDGRINREVFWLGNFFSFFAAGLFLMPEVNEATGVVEFSPIMPVVITAVFWTQIALCVKRLHDRGLTGWLAAVNGIPFVGVLAFIIIGLIPGQPGPNAFGQSANARG